MNTHKPKSGKKEPKQIITENPYEALMGIGKGMAKSFRNDVANDSMYDAWDQFLGNSPHAESGELQAGEEIDFDSLKKGKNKEGKEAAPHAEPAINYHREVVEAGRTRRGEDTREIEVKIQEILIEIKKLAGSSSELQEKVEVIAVEQMAEKPGVYHLNFFEQILQWIRDARMNVEDSLAWFHALRSKKAAKQYGVMAKKGGTSFTLSNERVVATQTG